MKKFITSSFVLIVLFLLAPKCANAQWVQTNGPYGGSITGFVAKDSNLFALSSGSYSGGGIYVSTNDGINWKAVSSQVPKPGPIILAGSNLVVGSFQKGIFVSSDNGTNWVSAKGIDSNDNVDGFTSIGRSLFAATNKGIFLSTNDGEGWTSIHSRFGDITGFKAIGSTLFAGTYNVGFFMSTDYGVNWTVVDSNWNGIRCFAVRDTTIFAAGYGIYRSTDGGEAWKVDSSNITNDWRSGLKTAFVAKDSTLYLSSSGDGIRFSTDNGKEWLSVNTGLTNKIYANALFVNGTKLFAGSAAGVFRLTENDTSWQVINSGITDIANIVLETSGTNIFAGTNGGGVFRTSDNGQTWVSVNNGLTYPYIQALRASGTDLFAGTSYRDDCLFYTNNDGEDWTVASLKKEEINSITIHGDDIFIGNDGSPFYDGIHRSTDGGTTWSVGKGLSSGNTIAIVKIENILFAGVDGSGVYRSDDNGGYWYKTSLSSRGVRSLVVKGVDLVACTNEGVFISTDLGNSWTQRNSGLTDTLTRTLLVNGSNLFVGTFYSGIFFSTNDGASWKEINTGLTEMDIRSLKVSGEYLFAATHRGVWRRPLSEMIPSAVSSSEQSTPFTLEPSHPNPFTDYTSINFALVERGYVVLDVYDLLGQKIKTLISEILDAGKHSTEFDAKHLAAGVYVVKLRVGGAEQEMKIVKIAN